MICGDNFLPIKKRKISETLKKNIEILILLLLKSHSNPTEVLGKTVPLGGGCAVVLRGFYM